MVKLSGKLGKSSGSPSGPEEFEQEVYMTSYEAAAFLRELAAEIESGGGTQAATDTWAVGVQPMQPIKIEVQFKHAKRELEIQVKLKENP